MVGAIFTGLIGWIMLGIILLLLTAV
jgi:hypothetical protein